MKTQPVLLTASALLMLGLLAGCSSTPPVETVPTTSAEAEGEDVEEVPAEEEEPAEAEPGTRENPLDVGEMRKISDESMWTIGAEKPTVVSGTTVRLPLYLGLDWDACELQAEAMGSDPCAEVGVNPSWSLSFDYVTAGGKSYNMLDYVENMDWDTELSNVGDVYPPLPELHSHFSATVPAAEQPGGVWKVTNGAGDAVYIASGL